MKQVLQALTVLALLIGLGLWGFSRSASETPWSPQSLVLGPSVLFSNYQLRREEGAKKAQLCKYPFVTPLPLLRAAIFFGYKDARPERFVSDLFERTLFIQKLLSACQTPDEVLCQFQRSPEEGDLFHRKVKDQKFEISVFHSSLTFDDGLNREMEAQRLWSERSQKRFLEALQQEHIVFYNGHSRDGGGPDFDPPRLNHQGKVDYAHYEASQPYFQQMLKALAQRKSRRLVLGLYSCASLQHFSKELLAQDIDLISSPHLLYYADALENLVAGLEGIFAGACEKDLREALKEKTPRVGSQLSRGFKN